MESEERPAKIRKLEHLESQAETHTVDDFTGDDAIFDKQPSLESLNKDFVNEVEPEKEQNVQSQKAASSISKNQFKKLKRHERWEAGREDRKRKRKEKNKERKERRRAVNKDENAKAVNPLPLKPPRHSSGHGTQVPIAVILDCDFEDLMLDQEIKSLGLQITRCYSDNRKAKFRAHLALSSFGGKMKERFDGILAQQYTSWKGFQFFEEDFVTVAKKSRQWLDSPDGGEIAGALRVEAKGDQSGEGKDVAPEGEIIYLSSESDHVLTRLEPYCTYIIGGLVDKNRHKGICHKRAVLQGIKTAKLPIGQFLEMNSRSVLVTNHVLEIMLKWMEFGDWAKAFMEVLPKRKGGRLRKGKEDKEEDEEEEDGKGDSEGHSEQEESEKCR